MRFRLLPFALALIVSPAAAQDADAVNDMRLAANRADYACARGQAEKCTLEVKAAIAAGERALKPTSFSVPLDKALQPAWGAGAIPGPYDPWEGAFRFTCGGDGPLSTDDPIDYAGQPGAAHLHLVWGNEEFDALTDSASLAASAATNCNATPFSTNRSSYWMPALVHDAGYAIRPDLISVYYKRKTASSPYCSPGNPLFIGRCIGIPGDIRFIWGWNRLKPTAPVQGASWYCTGGTGGHFPDLEAVFASGCGVGDLLIANTLAPNCWDGRLDSPDHRSHVTYVRYDDFGRAKCPATHPNLIPQEENKAQWTVTADMIGSDGKPRIALSSDHMLPGARRGQTLHADYWEKWVAAVKALWLANCIDKGLNCSGGDLGNGQQLIGAGMPKYGWVNPAPRVQLEARSTMQ